MHAKRQVDLRHLSPIPRAYGLQRMAAPPTVRSRRNPDLRRMLPRKEIDMYHRKGARTPPETQNDDTPPRDFAGGSSGGRKPSARSKNWYWYGKGAEPKHDTVPAQPWNRDARKCEQPQTQKIFERQRNTQSRPARRRQQSHIARQRGTTCGSSNGLGEIPMPLLQGQHKEHNQKWPSEGYKSLWQAVSRQ